MAFELTVLGGDEFVCYDRSPSPGALVGRMLVRTDDASMSVVENVCVRGCGESLFTDDDLIIEGSGGDLSSNL